MFNCVLVEQISSQDQLLYKKYLLVNYAIVNNIFPA